jgi:imidazolonepropionase-like amidohydrolase/ABC-type multidrug transport system permease subunit
MNTATLNAGDMPRSRLIAAYLSELRFEFIKALRNPMFAVPTLVFPAMFYLLFGVFLGSAKGNNQMALYALAGYGIFGAMGPGLFSFGVSLAFEREQGLLVFKQALPVPAGAQIIARMVMAMIFVGIIALMLIGMAVGIAGVPLTLAQAATLFAIDVLCVLPFAAIGLFIGASVPGQAAPAVINLVYLPMAFLSGLWMPMQFLPKFLQNIADIWPAHHFAQFSLGTLGLPTIGSTLVHVLVPIGYTLVFFMLAMRKLQSGGVRLFGKSSKRAVVIVTGSLLVAGGAAAALLADKPDATAASSSSANSFAIRDVRVFDGEHVLEKANVVVRDGRIVAVGAKVVIPADLEKLVPIDGKGRTLLPGLIDAHVHTYGKSPRQDALRFGVTTELDMFTDWHGLEAARKQRDSLERTDQSDLFSAGTLITVKGGHGTEYGMQIPTLEKSADAENFIAERVREGSDYIKLVIEDGSRFGATHPTLSDEQVVAVVKAAHTAKKLAIAHVSTERDAEVALGAGADMLAHLYTDKVASDALVAKAKAQKSCVIATLTVIDSIANAGGAKSLLADSKMDGNLSGEQRAALQVTFPRSPRTADALDNALASVGRLHQAGVRLLAGTDAGNPGTTHGASLHHELELLVRGGLSPAEALAAATGKTADCFDIDRGRIKPGARADLVLVVGNPTEDIKATRAIETLWKNGYTVARDATAELATAGPVAPAPEASLIADFEDGTPAAKYGFGWNDTSDALMGGKSTAKLRVVPGSGAGNKHALEIAGEINTAVAYPWAGAMFFPEMPPMQGARDYSKKQTVSFRVRGDGRHYNLSLFSGPASQNIPANHDFVAGPEWTEVSVPLASFNAELGRVSAFGILAGGAAGAYRLEIDDVHVR